MSVVHKTFDGQPMPRLGPEPSDLPGVSFVPNYIPPVPVWTGFPTEGVTIDSLVQSEWDNWPPSEEEIAAALVFYDGQQWDRDVSLRRLAAGRPCLVVNRLPGMAAAIIHNSGRCTLLQISYVVTILYRRCKEAQMLYNYMASSWVESGCKIVMSAEEKHVHTVTS